MWSRSPNSRVDLDSLRTPLDFWLYFFKNGLQLDADALPAPLAMSVIRRAMEVLKVFSQDELDRDLYENRLKGQRDHQAFILARDQAFKERDEAEQHATHASKPEQHATEAERDFKQALVHQIRLCQRLLGHHQTDGNELMRQSIDDLRALAERLEQQLPGE